MNRHDLSKEQCQKMHDALAPTLGYLSKLQRRIDDERFPQDDALRRDVADAHAAMMKLTMQLHYLTCGNVGQRVPANTRRRS